MVTVDATMHFGYNKRTRIYYKYLYKAYTKLYADPSPFAHFRLQNFTQRPLHPI